MTESQFRKVLQEAMDDVYSWIPDPEDLDYDYTFSPEFDAKMEQMLRENGIDIKLKPLSTRRTRFGRRTFRRAAIAILAAVLILALAACTIYFLRVNWNETPNDAQGTLDVTFDIDDPQGLRGEFELKRPQTPDGFSAVEEVEYSTSLEIEYRDDNRVIYYDQTGNVETAGLSLDNEDGNFEQITIHGHKGYAIVKGDNPYISWSDGISLYYLSGNVPYELLKEMAESIK